MLRIILDPDLQYRKGRSLKPSYRRAGAKRERAAGAVDAIAA
jgi:hypothetical protein